MTFKAIAAGTQQVTMHWTVEADTARDVVSWPEEGRRLPDGASPQLRRRDNSNCSVDVVVGSLSAGFQVSAERQEDAESVARRIMMDALEHAGLPVPDEPLAHIGVHADRVR